VGWGFLVQDIYARKPLLDGISGGDNNIVSYCMGAIPRHNPSTQLSSPHDKGKAQKIPYFYLDFFSCFSAA